MTAQAWNPSRRRRRRERVSLADLIIMAPVWATLLGTLYFSVRGTHTLVSIGAYEVSVIEPMLATAIVAFVYCLKRGGLRLQADRLLLLCISAIGMIGFLRGLVGDPQMTFMQLRGTGVFIAMMALGAVMPRSDRIFGKIATAVILVSLATAFVTALRVVFGPTVLLAGTTDLNMLVIDGRPISAFGAVMMAVGASLALARALKGKDAMKNFAIAAVLFLSLVVSRQATAGLSGLVGLLIVFLFEGKALSPKRQAFAAIAACIGCVVSLVLLSSPAFIRLYDALFNTLRIGDRQGTLQGRQEIWRGLMTDYADWSLVDKLIGLPGDQEPIINVFYGGGSRWYGSVHSMYFGSLVFMGAIGLGLFVIWLAFTSVRSVGKVLAQRPETLAAEASGPVGLAILLICGIFGFSYELRNSEALFLILAAWAAAPLPFVARQPRRAPGQILPTYPPRPPALGSAPRTPVR